MNKSVIERTQYGASQVKAYKDPSSKGIWMDNL